MNNNVKIATQAQLKELQEKGVGSFWLTQTMFLNELIYPIY